MHRTNPEDGICNARRNVGYVSTYEQLTKIFNGINQVRCYIVVLQCKNNFKI
jgi:hypothetical protein